MCGIVGFVGNQPALPVLLDGMARLEYRGYDSAGVAILRDGALEVTRRAGKLETLVEALEQGLREEAAAGASEEERSPGRSRRVGAGGQAAGAPAVEQRLREEAAAGASEEATLGIGHTRWATHGAPNEVNAHPHRDCTGRVALVHNGIIENHDVLRARLTSEGHVFVSETDTEVAAHLVESVLTARSCTLREAVLEVAGMLEGAFALVCITSDEPDTIVVARQEPPLVVGAAPGIGLVASDIPALLSHTREVVPLDNRQIAEVRPGSLRVFGFDGAEVAPQTVRVDWDIDAAERGGYEDFMLKEIFEQPTAVRNTLRGRIEHGGRIALDEVRWSGDTLTALDKVVIVACGTSYHAGMAAKHSIEHWTRIPVELDLASEFRYRDPVLDERTLVIGIAQSGETADTLAAVRFAKEMGATVVAVTNVVGSSITRDADAVLTTHAGPEIGVAATKTFLCQLVALNLLALHLAQERGSMPPEKLSETIDALEALPGQIEEVLALQGDVHRAAKRYAGARDFLFIGRGVGMAVAMEGALKLKEISYIHAEGYAAGELKHGAIALVTAGVPVVGVLTGPRLYDKMLINVSEVRARGADTILIAAQGDERARAVANELFEVPPTKPLLTPVLDTVCLQMFAYFVAKELGLSPDKPRNLAKSVTVE